MGINFKNKKAPYYLLIHTDSYTGNFERELIAFVFGKLDEEQEGGFKEYAKAFWNKEAASNIDTLEEYENMQNESMPSIPVLDDILDMLSKRGISDVDISSIEKKREEAKKKEYDNSLLRLYDTYLCYTKQEVDDWEQETFYNIESWYKNKKYNCDTIFVQLKKPLNEKFEKLIIQRIKDFFKLYPIIERYIWVCQFGKDKEQQSEYKLLDIELVNGKYDVIKKYDV